MKSRYNLIFTLLLLCSGAYGQHAEINYLGTLIATGPLNPIPLTSDGPFPIGFNFIFYGNTYSDFYVSENGRIMFNDPLSAYSIPATIPSTSLPDNYIAPFWDNLTIDGTGNILYRTIGVEPNRKLVVQYRNMMFWNPATFFGTFSVILYETSNIIQVQYRQIVDNSSAKAHGSTATIGIENLNGTAGALYSYQNPTAITSEQAISFTPGSPYIINSTTAEYDGVFLISNETLPEPGITNLISPPHEAIVGADNTFRWDASSDASSYSLLISLNPDLGGAVPINVGSNLSYDSKGLTLNETYYWGVFATNATGTTWCEIKKFFTNSSPPLAPVPLTIWTEQSQDTTIKLQYTGGDASPKTAIITSLPAQGQLYQYNSGVRGSQITLPSLPAVVTDPAMNVIYSATGSTGNGVGNFKFKINDAAGDSPEGTITVNVSLPGIPNVLYFAKSTNSVEIQFDILMADPTGKQSQFFVTANGTSVPINSAALKTGDNYTIVLSLGASLTNPVLISYTQDLVTPVTSILGGVLLTFTNQPVTLTAQTITWSQSLSKKYSDSPFTLTASAPGGSMTYSSSNQGVATIPVNIATFHALGSSDITARQAGNATYARAKYTRTLTVAIGDQTIAFSSITDRTFGDPDFTISASATSTLPVSFTSDNPAVATVTGNTVHIVGAGTTVITASQAGNSLWNPADPVVMQTLTVNKANQTISFSSLPTKVYGDPDFSPGATASSGLSVSYSSDNAAVATVVGNLVHIAGVGSAVITASQAGNANYEKAIVVQQTLNVSKADQTITFSAFEDKTYGNDDFNTGASVNSGLTVSYDIDNPAVATILGDMIHITGAGSTVITASQTGNTNFNKAIDVLQTLIVKKADLTFTADDKSRVFNTLNPVLTYQVTGFMNSENQSVLDVLPNIETTALQNSPIGDYPITILGGSDNNYNYIYVPGTLTITKYQQTITITDSPEKLLLGDSYTLVATSTSGLPVLFESMDPQKATVTGDQLTGVSKGTVEIRAYHPGDLDYDPAEAFASVEIWSTHKDIMYLFTPNNDGINDYWELPDLATWGKCDVKVYNRWGKLVFADADYNNLWKGISNGNPLPEGAYYFVIKTENAGTVKGTVNLVR